jgi:hypothetical protein
LLQTTDNHVSDTCRALEKLNASFPNKASSLPRGPESVASHATHQTAATTVITVATTARSTAGLLPRNAKKSSNYKPNSKADSEAVADYYRPFAQQGKPVPILPHSRLVKPGPAAIKVPAVAAASASTSAAAAAAPKPAANVLKSDTAFSAQDQQQ